MSWLVGLLAQFSLPPLGSGHLATLWTSLEFKLRLVVWPIFGALLGSVMPFFCVASLKMIANSCRSMRSQFDKGEKSVCCVGCSRVLMRSCAACAAASTKDIASIWQYFGNSLAVPLMHVTPVSRTQKLKHLQLCISRPRCHASLPCGAQLSLVFSSSHARCQIFRWCQQLFIKVKWQHDCALAGNCELSKRFVVNSGSMLPVPASCPSGWLRNLGCCAWSFHGYIFKLWIALSAALTQSL